jgi:hypothetical protein
MSDRTLITKCENARKYCTWADCCRVTQGVYAQSTILHFKRRYGTVECRVTVVESDLLAFLLVVWLLCDVQESCEI